jgi:hypothetical protein
MRIVKGGMFLSLIPYLKSLQIITIRRISLREGGDLSKLDVICVNNLMATTRTFSTHFNRLHLVSIEHLSLIATPPDLRSTGFTAT